VAAPFTMHLVQKKTIVKLIHFVSKVYTLFWSYNDFYILSYFCQTHSVSVCKNSTFNFYIPVYLYYSSFKIIRYLYMCMVRLLGLSTLCNQMLVYYKDFYNRSTHIVFSVDWIRKWIRYFIKDHQVAIQ